MEEEGREVGGVWAIGSEETEAFSAAITRRREDDAAGGIISKRIQYPAAAEKVRTDANQPENQPASIAQKHTMVEALELPDGILSAITTRTTSSSKNVRFAAAHYQLSSAAASKDEEARNTPIMKQEVIA